MAYQASPDQVLVIYNADWKKDGEGTEPGQDSKEVAEYYVQMHTDPETGKKPHLLGLSCVHWQKKHLNAWKINEDSHDNKNGLVFKGKGSAPENPDWVRDSRSVEITVPENNTDWTSLVIRCRSDITGEEKVLYQQGERVGDVEVWVSGPSRGQSWNRSYPLLAPGKGRCFRFDASKAFPGPVTVFLTVNDLEGKTLKDLKLKYFDRQDFEFSTTGPDGVSDQKNLDEDVLQPVKKYLENPANALPDGTLLKDHILYIVLVHGMPYSGNSVFGIAHGATSKPGDHGALGSLEQRLQTLYYGWGTHFRPPVISMYMGGGPDSRDGVANHIITTALRSQLTGRRWNPYIHPDTYSFLRKNNKVPPALISVAPLPERRKNLPYYYFAYGVTRIDGSDVEEAKQIVDYSVYASRYLRPEMDCNVRQQLCEEGSGHLQDLPARLAKAEKENLWGREELEALGFAVYPETGNDGLPFLLQSAGDGNGSCLSEPKWNETGFYPGGMGRRVISGNGWNSKKAEIWQYLDRGVTVSACGAPAYGGGPHITNATFWDNRILMRYLFRGKDLGEALLLSTLYVNWSTSLIGDPLLHPDLNKTVVDRTPPLVPPGAIVMEMSHDKEKYHASFNASLDYDPENPEVARMMVRCEDNEKQVFQAASSLYSRRPEVSLAELPPGSSFTCEITFDDPYGNMSEAVPLVFQTKKITWAGKLWKGTVDIIKDIHLVE
ncbi:MAG: hypothetical protein KAT62_10525 [Desulfuromonadales bacterium]|nr:hypothetical protein [Desulfuromonadales bacterium]